MRFPCDEHFCFIIMRMIRTFHAHDNKSGRRFAASCSAFGGMLRCLWFLQKFALWCAECFAFLAEMPIFAS